MHMAGMNLELQMIKHPLPAKRIKFYCPEGDFVYIKISSISLWPVVI